MFSLLRSFCDFLKAELIISSFELQRYHVCVYFSRFMLCSTVTSYVFFVWLCQCQAYGVCVTLFIKWLWEYKQSVEGQRRKGHLRWPVRKQRNWGNPARCLEGSRTQCDSGWSWSFSSGQLVNGSKHTEPWTWAINKKDHWSWPLSNRREHSSVRVPSEPWVYSCFKKKQYSKKRKTRALLRSCCSSAWRRWPQPDLCWGGRLGSLVWYRQRGSRYGWQELLLGNTVSNRACSPFCKKRLLVEHNLTLPAF